MAADSKDVELRIRARDFSQKTLDQVVDSLQTLAKAQGDQIDAAKKGEASARSLEDAYRRIEQAATALSKQGALVETFKLQSAAVETTAKALADARVAQKSFADGLKQGEDLTKAQIKLQGELARAVRAAEGAQQRAADRLASTAGKLNEYGIATGDVAQAQSRIVKGIAEANAALERQDAALASLDAEMRKHKDTVAELAAERVKQANAEAKMKAFTDAMAAQKEKELATSLEAIDASEREREALRRLADQMAQTAKGYQRLASAQSSRSANSGSRPDGAQSLRDIADPAAAAMRTVDGLERSFAELATRVNSIRGPVKDAQAVLQGLAAAQKAAIAIAGQVDAYQRQIGVLRAARAEYAASRAEVERLVAQLRAGTGGDDIVSKLAKAQSTLRQSSEAMAATTTRTREMRDALRAAGVQTNDLAGQHERLVAAVRGGVASVDAATNAVKRFGVAKGDTADKIERFNKGERTTLSFMQRMRGEALALTATYIGLNATIGGVSEVLNVVRDFTKIDARFVSVFGGDAARAREETEYLRGATDRIGVSFRDSALEYSKFIAATNEAKWTVQETRFVFEQFAEAAVRTGQSKEEFKGIMLAITQMVSKGKVGAEELTQQLAERLPGAVAKMANSLNIGTADLLKRMEASAVSSRAVINLAQEMMKDNANAVLNAGAEMIRAEGRLATAKDNFSMAIADAGFTKAYSDFLQRLTALLSSPQGKALADGLGKALTLTVDVLTTLADNLDTVRNVLGVIVGLKIVSWVTGLVKAFGLAGTAIGATAAPLTAAVALFRGVPAVAGPAAVAVGGLATAIGFLARAIPVLGLVWTVWEAGKLAMDAWTRSSERARKEKEKLAAGTAPGPDDWQMPPAKTERTANPGTGVSASDMAAQDMKKYLDENEAKVGRQVKAARMGGAKSELAEAQRVATEELVIKRKAAQEQITDQKALGEVLARIDKQIADVRLAEQLKFNARHAGGVQTRVNREKQLVEDIARQMMSVEDKLKDKVTKADPSATFEQRMQARMDAIAHEYDDLLSKIAKLEKVNPKAAQGLTGKVADLVKQRQEVEAIKVKTEELQRLEKVLSDTQSLRAQRLEEIQALFDNQIIGAGELRDRVRQTNEDMGVGVAAATKALRDFAQANKDILEKPAFDLLMSRLGTVDAGNNPKGKNDRENMADGEAALNDTLARRAMMLDEIEAKQKLGLLTQTQAAEQARMVNEMYKQQILDQTNALLTYIGVVRAGIDPSNQAALLALDQLAAKIRTVKMESEGVQTSFITLRDTIINAAGQALATSLGGIVDVLGQVITGQKSVSQGLKDMAREAALSFAKMMRDAALYIIKLQIIKALENSGNPILQSIGTAMRGAPIGTKHTGGMAGAPSGSSRSFGLVVPSAIPRMHTGGVAGLKNDEVMRVLQKNEEVVTRGDPRHVLNGGTQTAQRAQRIVLVDERSRIPEAMSSAQGDEVTLQFLRRNKVAVQQLLGS